MKTNSQEQEQITEPKKSFIKTWAGLVTVLAVVLVLAWVIYSRVNKNTNTPENSWVVYNNEDRAFSIEHPNGWQVKEYPDEAFYELSSGPLKDSWQSSDLTPGQSVLRIEQVPSSIIKGLYTDLEEEYKDMPGFSIQETEIGGAKAVKFSYQLKETKYTFYALPNGSSSYFRLVAMTPENDELVKIISTFKNPLVNCEHYSNQLLKISFECPAGWGYRSRHPKSQEAFLEIVSDPGQFYNGINNIQTGIVIMDMQEAADEKEKKQSLKEWMQGRDYEDLNGEETVINGNPAFKGYSQLGDQQYFITIIGDAATGRKYTFAAAETDLGTLEKITSSFKVIQ
jgi:hypothetical protein